MDMVKGMQKAVDFIEEHLGEELDAKEIGAQAYLSAYHFQRLFSMVCGVSLGEYIRSRRLTLAGDEVEQSNAKIIDIALKYGYESPESFSRAFARFHGLSPMAARSQKGSLRSIPKISVQSILGGNQMLDRMKKRGYSVKENGAVYYTLDMDQTAKWFEDVLGWYAGIDERNENGVGTYGCATFLPGEVKNLAQIPFNGLHMFYGKPEQRTAAFIQVDDIENLCAFVKGNGWKKIGEIKEQPWGARECQVTTVDGSIIRFFQLI